MWSTRRPDGDDDSAERTVPSHRRRHRLPSNRAVIGGLLVTLAAAGVVTAHRAASAPPTSRYLVLTRTVDAGSPVSESDLGTIALDLPDDLAATSDAALDEVVGRVAKHQLDEFDLVRPSDLHDEGRFVDPSVVEVNVELTPAGAMVGSLAPGSTVDVLSTDPSGSGTETVARGVRVTGLDSEESGSIGSGGSVMVRLAVPDAETAEQVVDSSIRSELTLILPAPSEATR